MLNPTIKLGVAASKNNFSLELKIPREAGLGCLLDA